MENRFPKNVRQIGNVSDTPKIYVEDYVDTFLNEICDKYDETPVGAFLVGRKMRKEEKDCVYISGAIRIDEIDVNGSEIAIRDGVWELADAERQKYFEDGFVGWCICQPGQPLKLQNNLCKIHERIFGTEGSVLVIKAANSKEELFFAYKYKELMQMGGYFVYYEKNPSMQDYMIMSRKKIGVTPSEVVEDQAAADFRNLVRQKAGYKEQKRASQMMYVSSVILVLVIVVMGVTMMNNYEKMKAVQSTVTYIKDSVEKEDVTQVSQVIDVNRVDKESEENIEGQDKEQKDLAGEEKMDDEKTDESSDKKEDEVVSTIEEMSKDIYVVEKGDTLAKISKKIYGDTGHVDAICRMNGLTDGNLIFIGQKLLLP